MFEIIITILYRIFFAYCAFSVFYLFLLSFSGIFFYHRNSSRSSGHSEFRRIAILVPAYKEDNIILSTVQNLLSQQYPREFYDIYIIADSFQKETIGHLLDLP